MRSFDRAMPEELNRVLTDHARATCCCAPRRPPPRNLRAESVARARSSVVGDVMVDVALRRAALGARGRELLARARRSSPAATCSRPRTAPATSTTRQRLARARRAAGGAARTRCCLPLHPRTRARGSSSPACATARAIPGCVLTQPLGYLEFTRARCATRAPC